MKKKDLNFNYDPELYDLQVNWQTRLSKEKEFFKNIFLKRDIKTIIDIGCGTAHHLKLFAEILYDKFFLLNNVLSECEKINNDKIKKNFLDYLSNIKIIGIDPSQEAITYAKEKVIGNILSYEDVSYDKIYNKIILKVGSFENLESILLKNSINTGFDLITCLGNTLPILGTRRKVKIALKTIRKLLNKAGVAILQFLNFEPKIIEKERFYKPKIVKKDDAKYIFLKHFEYGKLKTRVDFLIIQMDRNDDVVNFYNNSSFLCTLRKNLFLKMAYNSGFKNVRLLGVGGDRDFNKNTDLSLFALLER